jgi:hypothetical protein
MFDHDGLSFCTLRAEISQHWFQPGLIGTHTDIDGTVASVRQIAD